ILSYSLWKRRFGGNSEIIGHMIRMEGEPFEIIGVMPENFRMIRVLNRDLDLWVPLVLIKANASREDHSINVFGRTKANVRIEAAQAEMNNIAAQLQQEHPETNANRGIHVIQMQENYAAKIKPTLLLLLAAMGFVALIACSNVTNLLFIRSIRRQKEI